MTRSLWRQADRWLTWFHRWAGVVLAILFLIWFLSGAVLHFVGFPSLPAADRLAHEQPIPLDRLAVAPAAAVGALDASGLRLISVAGRPVYIVSRYGAPSAAVAADTGRVLPLLPAATARTVAERFAGVSALSVTGPIEYDQWLVPPELNPYRPIYRVRLADAIGTDLYVSARTGEVVQETTASQREWNWCGAIVHWIYFTPLGRNRAAWDQTVWWISLVALVSAVVGIWLGFVRFAANKAARRRGLSPFRRWLRWHHTVGLFASVIVLGWILSGWLSMDEGRLFPQGAPTWQETDNLRGMSFGALARTATLVDLRAAAPAVQISLDAVSGHSFLDVQPPGAAPPRTVWVGAKPDAPPGLTDSLLRAGLEAAWPGRVGAEVARDGYDALYRLAESLPGSAVGFQLIGPGPTRVYVDRDTGRLLVVLGPGRRAYDWVYYALHTLNFPGLLGHPDLRTLVELLLLAVGAGFSATGVVLSVKRLRRSF